MANEIGTKKIVKSAHHLGWGMRNLIKNGGFDQQTLPSANLPRGWALKATPTVATSTDVATDAGSVSGETPRSIQITAGGTGDEGLQQTLTNLKADTSYTFWARVEANSGDTVHIATTGADTNLNLTSTSTTWVTISGQFITDSSGTNVVVQIMAQTDGDIVRFDDIVVVEGAAGPRPWWPNYFDKMVEASDFNDDGTNQVFPGLRIETGRVTEGTNPTTETFVTTFLTTPIVVASVVGSSSDRFVTIESVTTSQVVFQVRDAAGVDQDEEVNWIAIGP